jgi:8-oxo-dGTP pyrophosphatase MutT (NUDIX family)
VSITTSPFRNAARVIIYDVHAKRILFLKRERKGELFYVLPGGGIEEGETSLQAAVREAKEETNLDVVIDREVFSLSDTFRGKELHTFFFLAKKFSGNIKLVGPELEYISPENTYEHVWMSLCEISDKTVYPEGTLFELLKLDYSRL